MSRNVVGRVSDLPPGNRLALSVKGRPIVVFNLEGEFYALLNRCPHQSAALSKGLVGGVALADEDGKPYCVRSGEFIRCPWHGWEFDIKTGQSWYDPKKVAVRKYPVEVETGAEIVKGPFQAEKIPVEIDGEYIVVDL